MAPLLLAVLTALSLGLRAEDWTDAGEVPEPPEIEFGAVDSEPSAGAGRILLIGDSHTVGTFGHELDRLLRRREGAVVETRGSCGSSPRHWRSGWTTNCGFFARRADGSQDSGRSAPTPILADLLAGHRPGLVVIALGANLIGSRALEAAVRRETQGVLDTLAAADAPPACVWVGPPHGRNKPVERLDLLYDTLQATLRNRCAFIDSRPFLDYPETGGDGAHYDALGAEGRRMAREWAAQVERRIPAAR